MVTGGGVLECWEGGWVLLVQQDGQESVQCSAGMELTGVEAWQGKGKGR